MAKHTAASILETFYDAERVYMAASESERDFSPIAALFSSDFRLEQTSGLPYAGTYIGPEGLQEWAVQMANWFDVVDVQNPEIMERPGSDRVVSVSTLRLRVRVTQETLEYPLVQVVKVDLSAGLITGIQPFYWDVYEGNWGNRVNGVEIKL
ncbi:hypothetical protein B0I35DRAFT_514582 [Stachybotrys elegans]|uniref:SnoaL-like domain-containing protein n=1 Tax=Stachybotrys elegans TaxID=80388 RepID=A0A8K0SN94_9HYPO|nr:hypothetical protein B0I35DRAFT_514582 [Stachybotrys elegans]